MNDKSAKKGRGGRPHATSTGTNPNAFRPRKALLIEDDSETISFVTCGLEAHGYACVAATCGIEGLQKIAAERFDVAVIDIKLPDLSGFELIRLIRDRKIDTPIIVLSSMNTPADKIAGLNCGADDYLGKPFARDELIARIAALLRRANGVRDRGTLQIGDLFLSTDTREVRRGARKIELSSGEFDLLEFMMRHAGKTLSSARIVAQIWGSDYLPSSAVVETRVYALRRKLCAEGEPNMIFTVRGFGYVLR